MVMVEPPVSARLFFALWPNTAVREVLAHNRRRLGDLRCRWVKAEKLHLTLLFLGQVERARIPELEAAAGEVECPAFVLKFDTVELWRRPGILCMTPSKNRPELAALVGQLQRAVKARSIAADDRPYRAHLTLARRVRLRALPPTFDPEPVIWRAEGFSLVESDLAGDGSPYRIVNTWPLVGAGKS